MRQRRFPADVKKAPLERYFFSNGSGDLIEPYRAIAAVLDWGRTGVSFDCARVELGENVGDVVGHLRRKQPVVREHLQCRYMRRPPHAVRLGPVPYDHAIRPPGGGHLSRRDRNHRLVEQNRRRRPVHGVAHGGGDFLSELYCTHHRIESRLDEGARVVLGGHSAAATGAGLRRAFAAGRRVTTLAGVAGPSVSAADTASAHFAATSIFSAR